jgi:hypothetical protein
VRWILAELERRVVAGEQTIVAKLWDELKKMARFDPRGDDSEANDPIGEGCRNGVQG